MKHPSSKTKHQELENEAPEVENEAPWTEQEEVFASTGRQFILWTAVTQMSAKFADFMGL